MPIIKSKPLPPATREQADWFWSYIDIGEEDECWPWTRATVVGYGVWGHPTARRMVKSHRYAFFMFYGGDPYPAHILHKCDNRKCCNPHHMSLGGDSENAIDAFRKGRRVGGNQTLRDAPAKERSKSRAIVIPLPDHIDSSDIDRFKEKYLEGDIDSCWEWLSAKTPRGYGVFEVSHLGVCTAIRAPRLAYFIHYGSDPYPLFVRHSCDNPTCVNPHHLLLGDHDDNMRDKIDRNRTAKGDRNGSRTKPENLKRGEQHPTSRLTTDIVYDIVYLGSTNKVSYQSIANFICKKYGVRLNQSTVMHTLQGKNFLGKRAKQSPPPLP